MRKARTSAMGSSGARLPRRELCAGALAMLLPRVAFGEEPEKAPPTASPSVPKSETEGRDRSVAENYTVPVEGTDLVIAGATIGVNAPLADVKRVLLAFHRYKDILPRLQQSRVVAETDGATDVYMRAPIMNGLAAIWGVVRFTPLTPWRKRGFQLAGARVSGNVEKWTGKWMAFPCGDKRTLLKLELFCEVGLPLPTRVVTKWLLWACNKSVTAVRDMAECGSSSVAKD
jgi:hypothetical protein